MTWNVANFITLAVTFMLLASISVALRFWARTKSEARFGADDALIIPALLCIIGMTITMIVGTQIGEMAQHQTNNIGPHGPTFTEKLANYEKLLPIASLGFSKTSVLCFYRRMFYIYRGFLTINTILIVIVVAWSVSFFFATMFQCKHPSTLWTAFEYARVGCVNTIPFYYAVSISGFITDIMILVSPLPIIYYLQMPLKNRIAIACILLLGTVVCGAGIARFVTFVNIGRGIFANMQDLTYYVTPVFAWTMIESSLAVVGANLPLLRPLINHKTYTSSYAWSLLRSFRTRRSVDASQDSMDSESGVSFRFDAEKSKTSHENTSSAEATQVELVKPFAEGIYVKREFEVV